MAGRDEAFSTAYPALFVAAYRAAFRVSGDREVSSELAQEALIRAYVRWAQLEDRCEGWVVTTTVHLAIDRWRREERRPRSRSRDEAEPMDAVAALRVDLVRLLASLPRRQREVAVLRYLEDRPEAEVAEPAWLLGRLGEAPRCPRDGRAARPARPAGCDPGGNMTFSYLDDPHPPVADEQLAAAAISEGQRRLRRRRRLGGVGAAAAVLLAAVVAGGMLLAGEDGEQVFSGEGSGAGDAEVVTLTVRRDLPAGPIWIEGSTMVVRVIRDGEVLIEEEVGIDYEPPVVTVDLPPGRYTVHAAQRPCSGHCSERQRSEETHLCTEEVDLDPTGLELVAIVDGTGCTFTQRAGATAEDPVGFEVLAVLETRLPMGALRAAVDAPAYDRFWDDLDQAGPQPPVDLERAVVVSITIPDDACPPELDRFDSDGASLTPIFVEVIDECAQPLIPKTFLVALDRATLPGTFAVRLPGQDTYDFEDQVLVVPLADGDGPVEILDAQPACGPGEALSMVVVLRSDVPKLVDVSFTSAGVQYEPLEIRLAPGAATEFAFPVEGARLPSAPNTDATQPPNGSGLPPGVGTVVVVNETVVASYPVAWTDQQPGCG